MAKIDSAYAYYVSTYANQEVSRYDSHKKSDLRKVYNHIVRTNKESPLYKISHVQEAAKYAIDIKEHAKAIQNVVTSLSDSYGSGNAFQKKVAVSSDEKKVSVKYIGNGEDEELENSFDIQVDKLATPQINTGHYLEDQAFSFAPGSYSFDLNTNQASYELQYNVNPGETNRTVIDKLVKLVNQSDLGVNASVQTDGNGSSALSLVSKHTGLGAGEESLFTVAPSANAPSIAAMDLLGINNVTEPAANSSFSINGTYHSSLSNTFTINNTFELTLMDATQTPATIGFKANTDAVSDNIQSLVTAYNQMVETAMNYSGDRASDGQKLLNDVSSASRNHAAELSYVGLISDENGQITIDKEILSEALAPNRAEETFRTLTNFKDSINAKATDASINPMRYVNKVVVAYKNPGHNFATPYISSIYSGMMLDNYA